jgi:hypothetical protein
MLKLKINIKTSVRSFRKNMKLYRKKLSCTNVRSSEWMKSSVIVTPGSTSSDKRLKKSALNSRSWRRPTLR